MKKKSLIIIIIGRNTKKNPRDSRKLGVTHSSGKLSANAGMKKSQLLTPNFGQTTRLYNNQQKRELAESLTLLFRLITE